MLRAEGRCRQDCHELLRGKKDAMCAAKDGKGCCAGAADHCAAHANGK
jgi:hypothetical protein